MNTATGLKHKGVPGMKTGGSKKRTTKIVSRKFFGITSWEVRYYLNGTLLCSSKRKTREEARKVAKRYVETGMLPLI